MRKLCERKIVTFELNKTCFVWTRSAEQSSMPPNYSRVSQGRIKRLIQRTSALWKCDFKLWRWTTKTCVWKQRGLYSSAKSIFFSVIVKKFIRCLFYYVCCTNFKNNYVTKSIIRSSYKSKCPCQTKNTPGTKHEVFEYFVLEEFSSNAQQNAPKCSLDFANQQFSW